VGAAREYPVKVLFIMQGIPGSGKDHWLATYHPEAHITGADDYFRNLNREYDNGGQGFDVTKLREAHLYCFSKASSFMQSGYEKVAISNTNLENEAIAPYVMLAGLHGYQVKIVRVHCDANIAAARNTHGVPKKAYPRLAKAFEEWKPWTPWVFDKNVEVVE
jgi:predicted kinase